ncbi:MAG: nitrogen regulation protein NR(II) [Myxococcota bacterium]
MRTGVRIGAIAGRLVVIAAIFALAVALEATGRAPFSERELSALYAVVLAGFVATLAQTLRVAYGTGSHSVYLELAVDCLLITGGVYATGGGRSPFGFLYVVWIVYAALRAGPGGAALAPVLAGVGYAAVTLGGSQEWLPVLEEGDLQPRAEAFSTVATYALAFVAVAWLAHRLTREIWRGREELRELGQLHRRIVENVASGLLTVDLSGRVTSFNREAERITGLEASEVLGLPLEQLLPGISRVLSPDQADDAPGSGERLEFRFETRAGARLHLGLSRSVLRDSQGLPDGAVVIFQDLTQVTKMEEALRRSERLAAVGQLAAGLAHEIRNPLASLSGAIELLARDLPDLGESARRLVRIVGRETQRLDRLASAFLDYARPGPGRREWVDLTELLDELCELAERDPEMQCRIERSGDEGMRFFGNPDPLRQVFWNLLRNAAQSGPSDGCVRIETRREGSWACVRVSDRGSGIPEDLMEQIFEPFFTTRAKGTGLGLATVHRVVEAHGGTLEVWSRMGEGTRVSVRLPLEASGGDTSREAHRGPMDSRGGQACHES